MKYTKYDKESDVSYCFGIYPVLRLLELRKQDVVEIILSNKAKETEGVIKVIEFADSLNIPLKYDDTQMEKLTNNESVFVAAVFKKYSSSVESNANHLVLVNPSDMGNMGTIIRTAEAFNIKDLVIIKPAVDIFDPKVVRSSMGSIFGINFSYYDSFEIYLNSADKTRSYFLFMTNGDYELDLVEKRNPFSLVFGGEGPGLPQEFSKHGITVKIPQSSTMDSLNLSIAVGIALYKFRA